MDQIIKRQVEFENAWHARLKETMALRAQGVKHKPDVSPYPMKRAIIPMGANHEQTPDWQRDLESFGKTMYARAQGLHDMTENDLRSLEVPFFSIDSSILDDSNSNSVGKKISESELKDLRRRMVAYLQIAFQT